MDNEKQGTETWIDTMSSSLELAPPAPVAPAPRREPVGSLLSSLLFTGRVVVLTGVTLGIAVATWALSPIRFQADMGILLAFMFVWNMLGR